MAVRITSVAAQEAASAAMTTAAVTMGASQGTVDAAGIMLSPPSWDAAGMKAWGDTQSNLKLFSTMVRKGLMESARASDFVASVARGHQNVDSGAATALG